MPARINNLVAYSVYDLSHKQSTSFSGSHATTATGTPSNMIDKNLTTFYRIDCPYTGAPLGNEVNLVIDYGAVYWNCQLFFSWEARAINPADSGVFISTDGITWSQIDTANSPTPRAGSIMNVRYVKFEVIEAANIDTWLKVYECRLMGS